MATRGFGRIVNISSVNGQTGQFGQTNYAAAKAGMHGFTMALAREVARKGVTVNSVSPGYCETALVMAMSQEIRDRIVADVPVGRRSEEHTSELQSLMRISYAVFCLKKKKPKRNRPKAHYPDHTREIDKKTQRPQCIPTQE